MPHSRSTNSRLRHIAVAAAFVFSFRAGLAEGPAGRPTLQGPAAALEQGFSHPPDSARPWVYWFWIDGNVTQAGITADLEAMQRVGIGGVLLMDVTSEIPEGPVRFFSAEWRALFQHAVSEAARLGIQVSLNNAPGFTGSGGPWVTPELGMQKVVSSRTNLVGPTRFNGFLPRLPGMDGATRDIAILAFPTLVGEGALAAGFRPKVTASIMAGFDATKLLDNNSATFVTLPAPKPHQSQYLQMEFPEPFTASILKLKGAAQSQAFQGVLQISDDGRTFRDVREFANTGPGLALTFEQLSVRFFRLVFIRCDPRLDHLEFSDLELSPTYRIDLNQAKAGLGVLPPAVTDSPPITRVPAEAVINPDKIVYLTPRIEPGGRLTWDVPKGQWTVLRLGHTPTGTLNHPASVGGVGLECDKLSREAIESHFAAFAAPLIASVSNFVGHSLTTLHIDSWELGFQNWTPRFREEFQRRRGYDLLPYLPAISGRFVGGPEQSERFLWDIRRTIADLLADNYAGHLAELAHQHGLQLSIEAYSSQGKGPFDDLLYAARADVPMAEFWLGDDDPSRVEFGPMPSAAHTCGKQIVQAEAFTSYPASAKWQEHPFALKPLGDAAFCGGINRLVIHRYAHQPWLDRRPGMTLGQWGAHYERTQTWWEASKPWHEYLARCQFLLQQGLYVAELCYLTREGAFTEPPTRNELRPPTGYSYDVASPEVVLTRMSASDGRLVLPDGMSYHALVLPSSDAMTPQLLRKIKQLVQAGATVIGPRPVRSPSLADYPHCDAEVQQLAGELWGSCDGKTVKEQRVGKGTIICGKPPAEVLTEAGVAPDFEPLTRTSGFPLKFIHRRIGDMEIYFVANANPRPVLVNCLFRVADQQPEFWHPDSGQIEHPALWHRQGGQTLVPVKLDAGGSLFVIFRQSVDGTDPVQTITRDQQNEPPAQLNFDDAGKLQLVASRPGTYQVTTAWGKKFSTQIKDLPIPIKLTGKWDLIFPSQPQPAGGGRPSATLDASKQMTLDRLLSWTDFRDPDAKYFSGTATYTGSFQMPPEVLGSSRHVLLDLGKVCVIAELKVNGQNFGILWKPPFEADVTSALKAGENALEVKVTNLWPNRLIGDEQLPDDCRWGNSASSPNALAEWPKWLLEDKPSPTGRRAFATWKHWTRTSPLLESGLLGPVTIHFLQQATLN